MAKRKNPSSDEFYLNEDEMVLDHKEPSDPTELPPWYQQFMKLDEKKRIEMTDKALERIKEKKPDAYCFIKKFKCILMGVTPQFAYALESRRQGDDTDDMEVTWIHGYGLVTLAYWCPAGRFVFAVNANLDYNDTVLNSVKGNAKQSIRGLSD